MHFIFAYLGSKKLKKSKSAQLDSGSSLQSQFSESLSKSSSTIPAVSSSNNKQDMSNISNNSSNLSHNSNECEGCTLARVVLPDKATTVVQTKNGENIRAMVSR